jgi:hypothetical protein
MADRSSPNTLPIEAAKGWTCALVTWKADVTPVCYATCVMRCVCVVVVVVGLCVCFLIVREREISRSFLIKYIINSRNHINNNNHNVCLLKL